MDVGPPLGPTGPDIVSEVTSHVRAQITGYSFNWSEHEPHIDVLNMLKLYVCTYLCLCQSLTQIVLLYDNRFSAHVQNSSRAFNYPCMSCAS